MNKDNGNDQKLIFVSCGQQTTEEKNLGTSVKQLVDSQPGYKAYFAEYVQSLDALAKNILEGLRKCSGLISFIHDRGLVTTQGNKEWGHRSSVWVNQEIAILAYRKQFEGIEIPILVFKDKKVRLEGAMTSLIVNPIPMKSESEILKQIESWLKSTEFPLSSSVNDYRFQSKWEKLSSTSRTVISALLDEGGTNVKESSIKVCLREDYGMSKNEASKAILDAQGEFMNTDLVKLIHN
ncbi:unnamed protein product, partial [marine sediment metagenome]